jgi:hypothetical protein
MTNTRSTITVDPEVISKAPPVEKGIILISYPKIIFLYPAWLVSIFAGLYLFFFGKEGDPVAAAELTAATTLGWIFLVTLGLNFVVLAFDFPRSTSLLLFAVVICLILGFFLGVNYMPDLIPNVTSIIKTLHPIANSTFYLGFAAIMGLIYLGVYVTAHLDYWEVRPNELLHHHGFMSDLERFSSPNLRIDKEINDVFEFFLLRSGRLILHPSQEPRAIVLDNVFFINKKEEQITKLLGALQVQVRESN